jgi:hypothetical protein
MVFLCCNIKIICKDDFRSLIPVKIYGIVVNGYYDSYFTRYDYKRSIETYE